MTRYVPLSGARPAPTLPAGMADPAAVAAELDRVSRLAGQAMGLVTGRQPLEAPRGSIVIVAPGAPDVLSLRP